MMRFDCWAKCKTSWKRCALTLRGFEIRVPGAGWIGRDVYAFLAFTIRGDRRRNVAGGASGLLRWWALAQGSVDATFRDVASLRRCAWPARSFACPSGSRVREIVAWPASAAMVGMAAPMVAGYTAGQHVDRRRIITLHAVPDPSSGHHILRLAVPAAAQPEARPQANRSPGRWAKFWWRGPQWSTGHDRSSPFDRSAR
jgi:hypothetical protein